MTSLVQLILRAGRSYVLAINPIRFVARRFIERIPSVVEVRDGAICVDIGAGNAPYEPYLRSRLALSQYLALDLVPGLNTSIVADASNVPLASGSVDLVVSFDVIQHVKDSEAVLQESHRILRPNGVLAMTFPFLYCECDVHDYRRWTIEGMAAELERAGFDLVDTRTRGGRCFAFACALDWTIHHLMPGQRKTWRAHRRPAWIAAYVITLVISAPITLLQWVCLGLDRVIPAGGCYMGACVVATKSASNPT